MKTYYIDGSVNIYKEDANGKHRLTNFDEDEAFWERADDLISKLFAMPDEHSTFSVGLYGTHGFEGNVNAYGNFTFKESDLEAMNLILDAIVFDATKKASVMYNGKLEFVEIAAWKLKK